MFIHFIMYANIKSICSMPETNIYVRYISVFKGNMFNVENKKCFFIEEVFLRSYCICASGMQYQTKPDVVCFQFVRVQYISLNAPNNSLVLIAHKELNFKHTVQYYTVM